MDAKVILAHQLESGRGIFRELVGSMTATEWRSRLDPGGPMLGFIAWHMPATVDWTVQSWLCDAPPLRARPEFAACPGVNPPLPPFGMNAAEADAIASGVGRDDVLAYGDAVWGAVLAWLDAASDGELAGVPDPYERAVAGHERWPGYIEEVASMRGRPAWEMIVAPCVGHIRGHFGELDAALTALRRRS